MVFRRANGAWPAAALFTILSAAAAHAQSAPAGERVLASVDVAVFHSVIDADGSSPWPVQPRTAFTLQKVRTAGGEVKVAMTYRSTPATDRTPASSHPLDGARVEYNPSTGATTVFDQGGRRPNPRLSMDRPPAALLGSARDWLETLVFTPAGAAARRQEMEQRYGRPAGTTGRLTRYVHTRDEVVEELLADSQWGVPVEIATTRRAVREGRVTFEYGATSSGHLVRRAMRSERVIDPATGRRALLAIDFSNVRAEGW